MKARSPSTAQPTKFATPREAHAAGIATVHQELLLFPELTVAENIFLGQTPKTRLGHARLAGNAQPRPRASRFARQPRARCRREGRHAVGRQPPTRRDRARSFAGRARGDHGRADRGAGRSRRAATHGHRAPPEVARRRHRLCQPPHAGDLRARRPRDGAARRRACRHQGHRRGRRRQCSST